MVAAALVIAALVFIFSRPLGPGIHPTPIEIRLVSLKRAKPALYKIRVKSIPLIGHSSTLKQVRPIAIQEIPILKPMDLQQQMDMAAQESEQSRSQSPEFMVKQNPMNDLLGKALQFRRQAPLLENGEAYRSIYGSTVLESNGGCSELQDIQIGPSPSSRTTVALNTPCPGNNKPTMSDELEAWAGKRKAELFTPPR